MKDLPAVTADHVRAAVRLFDRLGEEDFLDLYHFRPATSYWLRFEGSSYPSKAILGVAHEFATGAALRSSEFTGGLQETVRVLERLGFEISSTSSAALPTRDARETYMLLWSPMGTGYRWSDVDRHEILDATLDGETVDGRWSIYANRKQVEVGDRVFLRKTGRQSPGVIAAGWVTSDAYAAEHWDTSRTDETYYVDIVWDSMVDTEDVLELTPLSEEFPHSVWKAAGGGAFIPAEIAGELERDWERHLGSLIENEDAPTPGPYRREIERKYALALVRRRRHQRAFRALLLANRAPLCEYKPCGIDKPTMLEAAHIDSDAEGGEPTLENGLLLCRNHHRAFDINLLGYDGEEFHWAPGVRTF